MGNGLYFSFSVFLVPLVEEFHRSRGLTAGAQSVSTVLQGLLAPVAGILVDRFGPRRVILTGAVLLSGASILGSTIRSAGELYLYTGVVGAAGLVGLGPVPMGVLLSGWFSERRGRAVGVAFSPADSRGSASALVSSTPAGDDTLRRALGTPAFWALWLVNLCTPLAVFPITTHQVAFAIDRGFAPLLAASVFGITGLMSIVGRVSFGLAADRFGGPLAATVSYGCTAGGALALLALGASATV